MRIRCRLYTAIVKVYNSRMARKLTKPLRLQLRLSEQDMQQIDDLRRSEPDVPTRSELLLRMLAEMWRQRRSPLGSSSRIRDGNHY